MTRLLACAAALAVVAAGCSSPAGPPPHVTVAGPTVPPAADILPDITVPPSTTTTTRPPRKVSRGAGRPQGPADQGPASPTPAGDIWRALANCESPTGRDSSTGKYHGYFQFSLATARSVGLTNDPHTYSYAEQLAAAQRLQARSGWGQWPVCARKLGLL